MKYLDEFNDPEIGKKIIGLIKDMNPKEISLMEVCGTHTMAIFRHGLTNLLPEGLKLLSGPGCPVCVTPTQDIDAAIVLAKRSDIILTTFGDMMRVPGSNSSLEAAKAEGSDIRMVYSPLDALSIANENPLKKVIFLGVGFETTSPGIASTIHSAKVEGIDNFWVYSCHKLIPPAMKGLLEADEIRIDGFICPGHVSTIIGSSPYEFISKDLNIPCVISGFEPLDILQSIYMLLKQIKENNACVEIQYSRCVKPHGNEKALSMLYEVFEPVDSNWRGIGMIPDSGLKIRQEYSRFDASLHFEMPTYQVSEEKSGCICGNILRGVATPIDCPLFDGMCTPEQPVGPCMVSSEGTCAVYYKYRG